MKEHFQLLIKMRAVSVSKLPPGHYTLEAMAEALKESVKKYKYEISAETYSPFGQLVITNIGRKPLRIDRDLGIFLQTGREYKIACKIYQTNKKAVILYSL